MQNKNKLEVNEYRPYKVMPNDILYVFRNDYNGKPYYRIKLTKRFKKELIIGYKNLKFAEGIEIPDKTYIIAKDFHEDWYPKDKYNTIFTLFIKEFDIIETKERINARNFSEYEKAMKQNDDYVQY